MRMRARWSSMPYPPQSGSWVTRRRAAAAGPSVPLTAAAVNAMIGYTPVNLYVHNQASGSSLDRAGSNDLAPSGTMEFAQSTPYDQTGLQMTDAGNEGLSASGSTIFDQTTDSWAWLIHVLIGALPAATRLGFLKGTTAFYRLEYLTSGHVRLNLTSTGTILPAAATSHANTWTTIVCGRNGTSNHGYCTSQLADSGAVSAAAVLSLTNAQTFCLGRVGAAAAMAGLHLFAARFTGATAESLLTGRAAAITAFRAGIGA